MNYLIFNLEIALKNPTYKHIYGYENISHITTSKLIEIFEIDIIKDPEIIEGYFLTNIMYKKHKKFLIENIRISLDLTVFEYTLRRYAINDELWLQKLYKTTLME